MLTVTKDPSYAARGIPFALMEVRFPPREQWNEAAFRQTAAQELDALRAQYTDYDRKAVFGEQSYFRFFRKFKKTYPVLLQFESVLFKGRPFPQVNPISEVAFLAELRTHVLSGAHDIDRMDGPLTLYSPTEKEPFPGMRGEPAHTYPNDVCGRDNGGIILSMIAGADARTCVRPDSRHVFYPVFGTPDTPPETLSAMAAQIVTYVRVLAPDAQIETQLL